MLTPTKIKRKLSECSKDELIELLYETVKVNKDAQTYVSVKLEGERALLEMINASKERIYKEFYPTRGLPKLKVSKVEQVLAEMKTIGKGTMWPFELMVYFCEVAVQFIHEQADILFSNG